MPCEEHYLVLRILFTTSLLLILLCKIAEPLVHSLRYEAALETPVQKAQADDEKIVIKVHASLPYTGNWEESDPEQKCFKLGDEFYNVVEKRYENDTLYFTLQRNLNARDKFDALSAIMSDLSSDANSHKQPYHHSAPSSKDFLTVFSPSNAPVFVTNAAPNWKNADKATVWHYDFLLPTLCSPVLAPPPDFA